MCGQPPTAAHAPRSDGPRRPRRERMRRPRVRARAVGRCAWQRYKAASLLAGRGAAQPAPYSKQRRAVRDRSRGLWRPPERSGVNCRWQASRRHLVVLALGRGASAPVRHATDTSKAAGDGHRSAAQACGVWTLPVTSPEAAPALGPRASRRASVRRRDRSSTPVRSSHHATAVARRARTRADTVAQQESRTPTQ